MKTKNPFSYHLSNGQYMVTMLCLTSPWLTYEKLPSYFPWAAFILSECTVGDRCLSRIFLHLSEVGRREGCIWEERKGILESLVSPCHISEVSIWVVWPVLYLILSGIFLSFFLLIFLKKKKKENLSWFCFTLPFYFGLCIQLCVYWTLFPVF